MKYLILLLTIIGHSALFSQTAFSFLESNNTSAIVGSGGTFFNDFANSAPGYEYPKGSGNHLIYANAFWFGGEDVNGNIKLSGQQYDWGKDLFPGPLTTDGTAEVTSGTAALYDQVYTVTKEDIDYHIQNCYTSGYVIPSSISDWPAHGDVVLDQDFYLAPFVDANNDQVYTPELGDYPLIRGDVASYVIMNDKLNVHTESGADPIGIECHFMFYQFATSDDLNNTTFVNIKVINRGTQTIYDFSVGGLFDTDLGDPNDDYMGSDSTLNLIYAYNATNSDAQYGAGAPAVGLVSLNHELGVAGSYASLSGPTSIAQIPHDYNLNMNGYYKDGSVMTEGGNGYGGTIPNTFQYHGDPNVSGEWSEVDEGNIPSDKRLFYATEPTVLQPFTEECYDFAIVIGDGGDHLENVTHLKTATAFVQDYYNVENYVCENYEGVMSLEDNSDLEIIIYPQPASDGFRVKIPETFNYEILAMDGKLVDKASDVQPNSLITPQLSPGVYLFKVILDQKEWMQQIVIE
ncbi:MAG: T9SS type A sorting domain-containing protein [Crocinitomicaceae bacterium]